MYFFQMRWKSNKNVMPYFSLEFGKTIFFLLGYLYFVDSVGIFHQNLYLGSYFLSNRAWITLQMIHKGSFVGEAHV